MDNYSWLEQEWQIFQKFIGNNKKHQNFLITGSSGVGKNNLALRYAAAYLCLDPQGNNPCYNCSSCKLIKHKCHVDLIEISPEDNSNIIKIEQIRNLTRVLSNSAAHSNRQAVIIQHADMMQEKATNALLKTLEEPPGDVTIILLSDKISNISPTIRSRCQFIKIKSPSPSEAMQHLKNQLPDIGDLEIERSCLLTNNSLTLSMMILSNNNSTNFFANIIGHLVTGEVTMDSYVSKLNSCCSSLLLKVLAQIIINMIKIKLLNSDNNILLTLQPKVKDIINSTNISNIFELYDIHIMIIQEIDSGIVWQQNLLLISLSHIWQQKLKGVHYVS